MANDNLPPLPELPPIDELLAAVKRKEAYSAPEKPKLSVQEVVEQLKEHFGKGDLARLVKELDTSEDSERTAFCPLLRNAQAARGDVVKDGMIKIIKTKRGETEIFCSEYNLVTLNYPPNGCRIKGYCDDKPCPFKNA